MPSGFIDRMGFPLTGGSLGFKRDLGPIAGSGTLQKFVWGV